MKGSREWLHIPTEEREKLKHHLKNWLLEDKKPLTNYGYDPDQWTKLIQKCSYRRRMLRLKGIDTETQFGIYCRLTVKPGQHEPEFNYIVGQSWNEEYITLLECLTAK